MSRRRFEGDPIEALRHADPLAHLAVPTDTTGAHARALFQEVTSMDVMDQKAAAPRRQPLTRRIVMAASAAAVAVVAVGAFALFGGDAPEQITGGVPVGGDPMAMCLAFDEATLAGQDFAFDGTVKAIEQREGSEGFPETYVTFTVHRWFRGGDGAEATYRADGMIGETSLALTGPGLEEGQRYLISGSEVYVWGCGYSLTYDTALAERWATLFAA